MPGKESVILIDADYSGPSMDAAIERVFDYYDPVIKGKSVLVKPNIAAQCRVEKAATTHPAVVGAVIRALKKREAGKIMVGDNPGPTAYGINERCAKVTGILDAAGECFINLKKRPVHIDIDSSLVDSVQISSEFFECDYVINLPKLKSHCHAYLTGAVKNMYGILVGGEKARLHVIGTDPFKFAEILVDIYCSRKPDLNIMDAVICMEGNGPTNGSPKFAGRIIAGTNGFAVDAVAAGVAGYEITRIKTLEVAKKRGLWSGDLDSVEIEGEFPLIKKFRRPLSFGSFAIFNKYMMPFVANLPRIDKGRCSRCGLCVKQCPVNACSFYDGKFPAIDRVLCIRCYCCQEFCPNDAISLTGFMFNLTSLLSGTTRFRVMKIFSRRWRRRWVQAQRARLFRKRGE